MGFFVFLLDVTDANVMTAIYLGRGSNALKQLVRGKGSSRSNSNEG